MHTCAHACVHTCVCSCISTAALVFVQTHAGEEIGEMVKALEQYGIQMPHFGKIRGIPANEKGYDEAAS